jgi:hypothetical protein
MSHGPKNSRSMRRTYLFVEALQKFEEDIKDVDLTEAYKKARPAFTGRLERNFVVLRDKPGEESAMEIDPVVTGANLEPLKRVA